MRYIHIYEYMTCMCVYVCTGHAKRTAVSGTDGRGRRARTHHRCLELFGRGTACRNWRGTRTRPHTHTHTHTHLCTHTHAHTPMYAHTHTRTNSHTRTRTHTQDILKQELLKLGLKCGGSVAGRNSCVLQCGPVWSSVV